MVYSSVSDFPAITYEQLKSLLMSYERHMDIVVHTGDCYYLEFKASGADAPRFFAAVQKKAGSTVLRLHWLIHNIGTMQLLSSQLLQLWDGNFSFIFNTLPQELIPELRQLLEYSLSQGYGRLAQHYA